MVARNVQIPMYQAKIPIRGGGGMGGRVDLTNRPEENPIVRALQQMMQQKRQKEQDALTGRLTEARIGQMEQPKQPSMKIVVGNGKTWLVDPRTGEKRDLGIVPPRSKVGDRNVTDIINDISKISGAAGKIPTESLEQPLIDAAIGPLRQELLQGLDLESYEEPGTETQKFLGMDFLWPDKNVMVKKVRPRKKVESKVAKPVSAKAEKRPPKPKEYPDAKWSEEHGMWTIVKNGRLMGVK